MCTYPVVDLNGHVSLPSSYLLVFYCLEHAPARDLLSCILIYLVKYKLTVCLFWAYSSWSCSIQRKAFEFI